MIDWVVRMQISSASTISQSHTDGIIEVVIELADLLTTLKTIPHSKDCKDSCSCNQKACVRCKHSPQISQLQCRLLGRLWAANLGCRLLKLSSFPSGVTQSSPPQGYPADGHGQRLPPEHTIKAKTGETSCMEAPIKGASAAYPSGSGRILNSKTDAHPTNMQTTTEDLPCHGRQ